MHRAWVGCRSVAGLVLLAALGSACSSATARARTEPPPLVIPEPPPRLIDQLPEVAELPPPEPVRREPPPAAPRTSPRARDRDNGAGRTEPRPEAAKPAEPVPPVETALVGPPAPRPELRTLETADEEEAAQKVRETLDRASRTLAKVDYRPLDKDGQEQYNTAKRFMDQAEEALKTKNLIAAKYLADKADTIAKGLTGR